MLSPSLASRLPLKTPCDHASTPPSVRPPAFGFVVSAAVLMEVYFNRHNMRSPDRNPNS
jgi:hypothetical protein